MQKNKALKDALEQKGAEILPWPEISDEKSIKSMLLPFSGKQGIIISGSSKNHWAKLSIEQQESVKVEIYDLVKNIDSDKFFLITGGTNFGVEKLFHEANLLKTNKIDILGLVSQKDTNIGDILDKSLSHVGVVPGNWWAKGDYQQLLVKHMEGSIKYLAIGGGAIVSDEITSMFLHGHKDKIFLYTGCDGASKDKSTGNSKGLPVHDLNSFISLLQPTQSILKDLTITEVSSLEILPQKETKETPVSLPHLTETNIPPSSSPHTTENINPFTREEDKNIKKVSFNYIEPPKQENGQWKIEAQPNSRLSQAVTEAISFANSKNTEVQLNFNTETLSIKPGATLQQVIKSYDDAVVARYKTYEDNAKIVEPTKSGNSENTALTQANSYLRGLGRYENGDGIARKIPEKLKGFTPEDFSNAATSIDKFKTLDERATYVHKLEGKPGSFANLIEQDKDQYRNLVNELATSKGERGQQPMQTESSQKKPLQVNSIKPQNTASPQSQSQPQSGYLEQYRTKLHEEKLNKAVPKLNEILNSLAESNSALKGATIDKQSVSTALKEGVSLSTMPANIHATSPSGQKIPINITQKDLFNLAYARKIEATVNEGPEKQNSAPKDLGRNAM